MVVELARFDRAERAEHVEVMPGAAAKLENACPGRGAHHAADHLVENSPPRGEPPMFLVEFGHAVEDGAVHQLSLPILSRTTYNGRCFTSVRMRPTYSPSTPRLNNCSPPRKSTATIIEA